MSDTMFNLLDTVEDDDLIQVTPVRGASDPAKLGSATDGKYFARKSQIGGGSDGVTSIADNGDGNLSFNSPTGDVMAGLSQNLAAINSITAATANNLSLRAGPADVESAGRSVLITGSDADNPPASNDGLIGGHGTITGGVGSNAVGPGDHNGGAGGAVELNPGAGGAGTGAGDAGDDGQVTVNGTPIFDAAGNLLQPGDELVNINIITALPDTDLNLNAGDASNDIFGHSALLRAAHGGTPGAGAGLGGGDVSLIGGGGSDAVGPGDDDGGDGGHVILEPGGGGDGFGAGDPGADGQVKVIGTPVFDRDGNLITPAAHLSSAGSADFPSFTIGSLITAGWYSPSAGQFAWATSGVTSFNFLVNRFRCGSDVTFGFADDPDVTVGTIDTEFLRVQAGIISVTKGLQTIPGTVAALPAAAAGNTGARAFVTDANTSIILGLGLTVVGGGANKVPVYSDGTNWLIG